MGNNSRVGKALGVAVASQTVILALALFLLLTRIESGTPYFTGDNVPNVQAGVKLLLDHYSALTSLVLAAFGLAGFLLTLQTRRGVVPSDRAGSLMLTGMVFLAGALALSTLGSETVLGMAMQNSLDLNNAGLAVGRWLLYVLLAAGILCVAFYAAEVALAPTPAGPRSNDDE